MNDLQPAEQKNKTVYRKTDDKGIRSIWDWSDRAQDYVQRRSGNRFQAYIEKNKKQYSECFGSLEEARKWRMKLKVDLDRLPDFEPITFRQLQERFIEKKKRTVAITTQESYISLTKHLKYFNSIMVEDINSKTIDRWLELVTSQEYRMREQVKVIRTSYIKELETLVLIFKHYREYVNEKFTQPVLERHFEDSVFKRDAYEQKKLESKRRYIPSEEIENLLNVFVKQADKKPEKFPYFVSCLIQLRTGLRIGEVRAIRWEEIDWNTGIFTINKTVLWSRKKQRPTIIGDAPKNRKDRIILFIPEILMELKKLQKQQARLHGLIFSEDGVKIGGYSSILHHYNYAMTEANVSFTGSHIMRHSFATDFKASGLDQGGALQGIMGHSSEKMTAKYAKVIDPTVLRGLQRYGELKSIKREQIAT